MISAIIPTYNHASSLGRCIESLLAQRGVEVEIIVVNDGSTDDTRKILQPYEHRVTALHQENAGSNISRNRGATHAHGNFILFVDADAVFEPTALQTLLRALQVHPKAGFAYSDFLFGFKRFRTGPFDSTRLKHMNFIHISALMRREIFCGFDESVKRFQDWDLWLTLLEHGVVGVHVPGLLMKVSVERAGISSWLPKGSYRAPWRWLPWIRPRVRAYEEARRIIARKHGL